MIQHVDEAFIKKYYSENSPLLKRRRQNSSCRNLVYMGIIGGVMFTALGLYTLSTSSTSEFYEASRGFGNFMLYFGIIMLAMGILAFISVMRMSKSYLKYFAKKLHIKIDELNSFEEQSIEPDTIILYPYNKFAKLVSTCPPGLITKDWYLAPNVNTILRHRQEICAAYYVEYLDLKGYGNIGILFRDGTITSFGSKKEYANEIVDLLYRANPNIYTSENVSLSDGKNVIIHQAPKAVAADYNNKFQ